ncbi:MAG: iron-containing alcohol dehydrogenase [Solirubrobacterales bacterium]|nr:iron-containing alcohol dehydrogenase [Solirubrobacterales bacterium]
MPGPDSGPQRGVMRAPREVLFGDGIATQAGSLASRLGQRVFVLTDPVLVSTPAGRRVLASLGSAGLEVEVFDGTVPELPLDTVLGAIRAAREFRPQCLVGLGGGSSLDLAKLAALGVAHGEDVRSFYGEEQLPGPVAPVLAIPTTAGTGSEVTPVAVLTDPEAVLKVGISSRYLIPTYALVDPTLTHGCPPAVTAFAGIDALAHAVEAYTAARRDLPPGGQAVFVGKNSLSDAFALQAVGQIAPNLVAATRDEPEARTALAYSSLCAGLAFGTAGTAVAHALQYPIGARTHTPHGLGTGLLLAYAMDFNRPVRTAELAVVGRTMGVAGAETDDQAAAAAAISAVAELARAVGVPASLAELGVEETELPGLARLAHGVTRLIANNPRELGETELAGILEAAWRGELDRRDPAPVS